jgi:hypothetical protein
MYKHVSTYVVIEHLQSAVLRAAVEHHAQKVTAEDIPLS